MDELNLLDESALPPRTNSKPFALSPRFNQDEVREAARGDLARGLLWLLTFSIGGVLTFVATGRLEGSVITQSIFPSLVALAGTALGFYFGSSTKNAESGTPVTNMPFSGVSTTTGAAPSSPVGQTVPPATTTGAVPSSPVGGTTETASP